MTKIWRTSIMAAVVVALSLPAFAQSAAAGPDETLDPLQVLPEVAGLPGVKAATYSATDALSVGAGGRVGIGTANPESPLHMVTGPGTDAKMTVQGPGGQQLEFAFLDDAALAGRLIAATGNVAGSRYFGFIAYDDQDGNPLPVRFFTKNSGGVLRPALWLASNFPGTLPYVGFGTSTAPVYPIQVANGAYLSAGGTWVNASSRELKEDIRDLSTDEARATLTELAPVKFKYLREENEQRLGFIAEDVPELVATADRKGLSPMDIVAVLTKVVQDQQAKIDELKGAQSKLDEVLERLDRQEAELKTLRAQIH